MLKNIKDSINIREILKFLVGGGSAVATDAAIYALLSQFIDVSAAKAISYITGASVGFVINKLWTFDSKQFKIIEVIKYILLYAFSACANTTVNSFVLLILKSTIIAFLCATGTSTVINFLGQKFIVFRKDKENNK